MAYVELTPLQKNSLPAKTTSLLASDGLSVEVDDQSVFYRDGTLLTKGWVLAPDNPTDSYTEEITVSATDDVTGEGTVTISARAVKADGANGAAREWPIGTTIKNTYTTSVHDQVIDNFIEHATLITARATKTTAAMSVYVYAAATGAADGTSWTDAFTTIQAAISSLPAVLEHAVTIYVRKGSSAYAENITVQQIVGKGSLTIRGEYYWSGECAAAATPSTTKFNLTSATGSSIAAGDQVLVRDGYADYVMTTVVGTVDKGSNVWEVEITDALPTGNIGSSDYYTICKTEISPAAGMGITLTNTKATISGLIISGCSSYHIYSTSKSDITVGYCILNSNVTYSMYADESKLTYYGCYSTSQYGVAGAYHAVINGYLSGNGGGSVVVNSAAVAGNNIIITFKSVANIQYQILKHTSGTAVKAERLSYISLASSTIMTGTVTGILAKDNSVVSTTSVTNNATTPKNPASSTDNPVIT